MKKVSFSSCPKSKVSHLWHPGTAQPCHHLSSNDRKQSCSQRPQSFWLATGITTSGQVQLQKSAIHTLPITLRMLRVKFDKSDWFWSQYNLLCLHSHSKPECHWAWPGVPIFPAHDKRDPWGRGWIENNTLWI